MKEVSDVGIYGMNCKLKSHEHANLSECDRTSKPSRGVMVFIVKESGIRPRYKCEI